MKHRVAFQPSKQIETGLIAVLTPIHIRSSVTGNPSNAGSYRSYCHSFMRKMTFKTCLNPHNLVVISTFWWVNCFFSKPLMSTLNISQMIIYVHYYFKYFIYTIYSINPCHHNCRGLLTNARPANDRPHRGQPEATWGSCGGHVGQLIHSFSPCNL